MATYSFDSFELKIQKSAIKPKIFDKRKARNANKTFFYVTLTLNTMEMSSSIKIDLESPNLTHFRLLNFFILPTCKQPKMYIR
jgi:hypothetical protein